MGTPIYGEVDLTVKKHPIPLPKQTPCTHRKTMRTPVYNQSTQNFDGISYDELAQPELKLKHCQIDNKNFTTHKAMKRKSKLSK